MTQFEKKSFDVRTGSRPEKGCSHGWFDVKGKCVFCGIPKSDVDGDFIRREIVENVKFHDITVYTTKCEHLCGLMGFNGMLGDICPACRESYVKYLDERLPRRRREDTR